MTLGVLTLGVHGTRLHSRRAVDAEAVVVEVDYAVTPVPFCSDTVPRVPG